MPPPETMQRVEFRVAAARAKEAARVAWGSKQQVTVYTIPTYVFNVVNDKGEGAVPEATLRAQVNKWMI